MNVIRKATAKLIPNTVRNYQHLFNHTNAYKSAISLEHLYPSSSLKITTPSKPESSMSSKFSGYIPIDQLEITYTKSSGPGGQNVNKVNTKVNLRFHIESAKWIDSDIKAQLTEKLRTKITKDGYLWLYSDLTRSQQLNLADCLNKLRTLILNSTLEAASPTPETEERIRKRLERAARERLMHKRERSAVKVQRQSPDIRDL